MNTKQKTILLIIAIIILAGIGYYFYPELKEAKDEASNISTSINSIKADSDDFVIKEISQETITTGVEAPNLDRKVVFPAGLSQEAKDIIQKKISTLVEELNVDSVQYEKWLDLGLLYKAIEDYSGAREVWEYVSIVWPQNSVSFHNLGDLYGYYLDDKQKAEENFLMAIENSPSNSFYYFKLAEFYRDVVKDVEKARRIVEQGLEENPDSAELQQLLESLK
ncbi:tetratricopeptide repeat protein [Patescibacteria group bacterium]